MSYKIKRICYFVNSFPRVSETFISDEAFSFFELGVRPHIFSLYQGNRKAIQPTALSLIENNAVSYINFRPSTTSILTAFLYILSRRPTIALKTLLRILFDARIRWSYLAALPTAKQVIREDQSYLHAHFADVNFIYAKRVSDWTNIPYGVTMHGYDITKWPIPQRELAEALSGARLILTVSEANRLKIAEKIPAVAPRIKVLPNGVRISPNVARSLQKRIDAFSIVTVGRLETVKGHDILLQALAILHGNGVDFRAEIIGDGSMRNALEELRAGLNLEHRVTFAGALLADEVYDHVARADLFVFPSRSEGFGVACVEAMSLEVPVVASAVGGLREIIEHGIDGFLVEPESATALADGISWMIAHRDDRMRMAKNALNKTRTKYSRVDITKKILALAEGAQ